MERRTFLKVTGVAGILAAGRAPAFAQGTRLHILRWVDFTPDGICTGPMPLTLPGDPTLTTSAAGAGALHFNIRRGFPLLEDVTFDVIWRVVDLADNTVLESDCLTVTVK